MCKIKIFIELYDTNTYSYTYIFIINLVKIIKWGKKYNTVGTVTKSNFKTSQKKAHSIPLRHKYMITNLTNLLQALQ